MMIMIIIIIITTTTTTKDFVKSAHNTHIQKHSHRSPSTLQSG